MARRSVGPPRPSKPRKPKAPVLTVEQKRRRIEQFKKCICDLEAFDPQKVPKRFGVPQVVALEAAIDKALSSAFGQGTSAYMRYNRAATLDHSPLVTNASVRSTVGEPVLLFIGGAGLARHPLADFLEPGLRGGAALAWISQTPSVYRAV